MADTPDKKPHLDKPISLSGGTGDDPIRLVDSDIEEQPVLRVIGDAAQSTAKKRFDFKRSMNHTGQGATRCRVFHSKISASSLDYMESQINEWLDGEDIEVKNVGHVIGTLEAKTPEPNVIVIVWY